MTKRFGLLAGLGFAAATMLTLFSTTYVAGQVEQGKERPLKTHHLMEGLVAPNCGALKKDLDAGPSDDKAWDKAAMKAELLNEASYILMADGRCPDAVWAGAAKTLRARSAEVLTAIDAKDTDAAKTAFAAMTKACGACHKVHKKKK